MSRLRRVFEGTSPFSQFGIVAWLVGFVMLVSILMSPNGWSWWMDVHSVPGHEVDGLVYYSVDGVKYTLNDPQAFAGSASRLRTVYFLSSQPAAGSLHNTGNEVLDWGMTAGPAAVGTALLATGFTKRSRRRRRTASVDPRNSFGQGIPSETIRAIVHNERPTGPRG